MKVIDILKTSLLAAIFMLAVGCNSGNADSAAGETAQEPAQKAEMPAGHEQMMAMAEGGKATEGQAAPDFMLEKIDGGNYTLSESKGKVIIIDFWATWCPPCVKGVPEFSELYNEYKDKGLEVVGLSVDRGGPGVVQKFVDKNNVPYPVMMANMGTIESYEVFSGIPTTFIVDREGKVVAKVVGYRPKSYFEDQVKSLL